jgi:arginyl-tRNA synthetase
LRETITVLVKKALEGVASQQGLDIRIPVPVIEMTRDRKFGDYATNAAMVMASRSGGNPADLARLISEKMLEIDRDGNLEDVSVAGPGFINMTMSPVFWTRILRSVMREGEDFARTDLGKGRRIQVEFVSANPTGPLHVGHGRGAALGDALANILVYSGFQVEREYYINDGGNQIQTLGRSVYARYARLHGLEAPFPEEGYKGEYIVDIARQLKEKEGACYLEMPDREAIEKIAVRAASIILEDIKGDLEEFGVHFDVWFSEKMLLEGGKVGEALEDLKARGCLYDDEGALWFRSTGMGDDKDRVLVKSDGSLTYFASDIAYHRDKFERGFDSVIDIWGADHHGYVARMKAAVQALGRDYDDLQVLLLQLVNLSRKGLPVAMSTRAGEFVTLREVREEVGRDAARFIFLTRKADSKLDFDLELAKERSNDNPVYYVQYAHARICSVLRNAEERGVPVAGPDEVDPSLLSLPEEKELVRYLAALPDVIEGAALAMEPHRVTIYLRGISTTLHNYYYHHRILDNDENLTAARLALVAGVRTVIAKALALLGVSAPERM